MSAAEGVFVESNIAMPNVAFDSSGKSVWFELSVSPGEQTWRTETGRQAIAVINCVVCVPMNADHQRSNNIASRIEQHFISETGGRITYQISDGVIYVDQVEQMPPIAVNKVHKLNVRFTISVFLS